MRRVLLKGNEVRVEGWLRIWRDGFGRDLEKKVGCGTRDVVVQMWEIEQDDNYCNELITLQHIKEITIV